jgi:hypothetical protein
MSCFFIMINLEDLVGLLLAKSYQLFEPRLSDEQIIKNKIRAQVDVENSPDHINLLLKMSVAVSMIKFKLGACHSKLSKKETVEERINYLGILSNNFKDDLEGFHETRTQLYSFLNNDDLKEDIDAYFNEHLALYYVYTCVASTTLNAEQTEWKMVLDSVCNDQDCSNLVDTKRVDYEADLADFKSRYADSYSGSITSVSRFIKYIDQKLERPDTPTLRYK